MAFEPESKGDEKRLHDAGEAKQVERQYQSELNDRPALDAWLDIAPAFFQERGAI